MERSGFRGFRKALRMSSSTVEDTASATGDELPPVAPLAPAAPAANEDAPKHRTDSGSSGGSQRSSRSGRSGRSVDGSHRRRRQTPPLSRPPSQSEELHLPTDQDFVPLDGEDEGESRARDNVREEVICGIFDLPRSTTFYKDFSCAIAAAFPMHGRMYPTSTHVCFYSNVFGRERKILIPYESITTLTKTTNLFQGAIRIKTATNEDFTFSSFWGTNRDRCFDVIGEIRDRVVGTSGDTTEEKHEETTEGTTSEATTRSASTEEGDDNEQQQQQRMHRAVSDGGIVAVPRDTTMELLVEETFPVSADDFIATFIADDAPFGHAQYSARIGTTEMQCNPWSARSEDESLGQTRSLQFRVPIDSPIGPNSSLVDSLQCHKTSDRGVHTIETSTRLVDIPYGDYFSVEDRWTVVPVARAPNECSLTIELKVVFTRSTFWKGQIEARAIADNKAKWLKWVEMAKAHLEAPTDSETRDVSPTNSTRSSRTGSNGTPLDALPSCPEKGSITRRATGADIEPRAADSPRAVNRPSRALSRTHKSRRRVPSQALPWLLIVALVWILYRLNATLMRMEQAMHLTELRVAEIEQHIARLQAREDVQR